jgi:cytosine/adenosine deaminase-related metal-dependent hydrolase
MSVLFTKVYVYDADAPDGMTGPTDVLIDGQHISAIGENLTLAEGRSADRVIDGAGRRLLIPGLINAHFHSPANHLKGNIRSLPLELFMLYESPSDAELAPSPREAYVRTMLAAIEMLKTGTTSVQDDAFLMPQPTPEIIDAIAQAYVDSGIRATVALDQPELSEAEKHPFIGAGASAELRAELTRPAPASRERLLELYSHLIERWHGAADGRLQAAVSISAPQRVSPEYFGAIDQLSRTHDLPLYAHILETRTQRTLSTEGSGQDRFAGRSLVRYTSDLGLLSERMNVIHAVWVDDADLELIAESGATIAHNPISNLRLGSGVMPFRAVRDHGIPIALGSDEAICDDAVNMWAVAKQASLIHTISGLDSDDWPTPSEVLDALWTGGARAQRREGQLGAVRPGMLADLALVNLHSLAFTPLNDVREQLVHTESGTDVELVMVDGTIVAENGCLTTVNETELLDEARELFAAKRPAIDRATKASDRWFPDYQRMVREAATTEIGINRWVGTR